MSHCELLHTHTHTRSQKHISICQDVSGQIHTAPPRHNLADMLSLHAEVQGDTACDSACVCEGVRVVCLHVCVCVLNGAVAKRLILTDCPVKRAEWGEKG